MSFLGNSPAMIQLGSLTLNYGDPDTSSLLVGFSDIDGWNKRAPMRVDRLVRSGHGEFAQPGKLAGRVVTITGWCVADVRAEVATWLDDLAATLGDGGFGELVVTDDDLGQRWATVQMLDDYEADWKGRDYARFQIALLAPDSFRYGLASTATTGFATSPEGAGLVFPLFAPDGVLDFGPVPESDGTATITNEGNAPAFPVFTVEGPTPVGGFRIVDLATGQRITFLGDVPAGSTLVMDASDGSVVINGGPSRLGETIVTRWPSIAPGGSATYVFAPESSTSAATLTVSVYSTYY